MDDAPVRTWTEFLGIRESRRDVGGLTAGVLLAHRLAGETAARNRKRKPHRRGLGTPPQLEFRFVTEWGDDGQFAAPSGVALDDSGNVYVTDFGDNLTPPRILKFTNQGGYLTGWGTQGSGDGQFILPNFIAIDKDGFVYVTDMGNARIQKFTGSGQFVTTWGTQGAGNGQFNLPHGIATDSAGNVYVVDQGNFRIQKFTSDGTFLTKWGHGSTAPGAFQEPVGIAIDGENHVYVADGDLNRIQKFDDEGQLLARWSTEDAGNTDFDETYGLACADGMVYATDHQGHSVKVFDGTGNLLGEFGSNKNDGFELDDPSGIAIDKAGNIFVADEDSASIKKFALA